MNATSITRFAKSESTVQWSVYLVAVAAVAVAGWWLLGPLSLVADLLMLMLMPE